jgi:hypothetical protein
MARLRPWAEALQRIRLLCWIPLQNYRAFSRCLNLWGTESSPGNVPDDVHGHTETSVFVLRVSIVMMRQSP